MKPLEIAVIGMSCRLPGATSYQQFWQNICNKENSIVEIPQERFVWQEYYSQSKDEANKTVSKWGGFLNNIADFDPLFFNISPQEARFIDPQQRLMLELTWKSLEDANIPARLIKGKDVGVFYSAYRNDYQEYILAQKEDIAPHMATGISNGIIANRVSYFLDITGPSMVVDAACAGSLVAIDMAIKSLLNNECELAFAGGVNIICSPITYLEFGKMRMLSPVGKCKTFSEDADGYVRGEGGGVLLLKPLNKALTDGDKIHAVIKGIAVKHGGGKVSSLTRPRAEAQAEVITKAWQQAGVPPSQIGLLEAHGTGTPVGDAIEIEGIKLAWQNLHNHYNEVIGQNREICAISAVKTNIGHLESAAGVAGVIKAILAMQKNKIPPISNFSKLNPQINLADTSLHIVTELQEWHSENDNELYAGVSSFGFGGVNSHIALANYKSSDDEHYSLVNQSVICCFSAKNNISLQSYLLDFKNWLVENKEVDIKNIAYTLAHGREHFAKRVAIIASNIEELTIGIKKVINTANQLVGKGKLKKIAAEYIAGNAEPLLQIKYQEAVKISLPGYVFDKNRYWLD
jgi:acyl transferase domain-containing protein